jgi:hypothetical protein
MFQQLLMSNLSKEQLLNFGTIFSLLSIEEKPYTTGRHPYAHSALLNALVYKNLFSISTFADLSRHLRNNPEIAHICGLSDFPSKERFSAFVRNTPNSVFQNARKSLLSKLIELKQISGNFIAADSCPIKANVKENNLKTNVKDRFVKTHFPKGDPDARLGIIVTFPNNSKKIAYFWGYRNHVLIDSVSELPVAELTVPANSHDSNFLVPQIKNIIQDFQFIIKSVIADSAFDSADILSFIINELKAKPVIAKNPRNYNAVSNMVSLSKNGIPLCIAGFEMISRGIYFDKIQNRTRHKFICPIKASKKFAATNPICPWNHPKFFENRFGCIVNLKLDKNIRESIHYSSKSFKELFNLRTSVERIFSRLLSICMQDSDVKGLQSIANICTISHITILVTALFAVTTGNKHKIRFIKKFFQDA